MESVIPEINTTIQLWAFLAVVAAASIAKYYEFKRTNKRDKMLEEKLEKQSQALLVIMKQYEGTVDATQMEIIYDWVFSNASYEVSKIVCAIIFEIKTTHSYKQEEVLERLNRGIEVLYQEDMSDLAKFKYNRKSMDVFVEKDTVSIIVNRSMECILQKYDVKTVQEILHSVFQQVKYRIIKVAKETI